LAPCSGAQSKSGLTLARALLFCHDGTSLGHLRRISRIAETLQPVFCSLIVTGMREAAWIAPTKCEIMMLPNWDSLDPIRSANLKKPVWLHSPPAAATSIRSTLLQNIGSVFDPDIILVDYLPYGQRQELVPLLESTRAMKYLIHRGISDTADHSILAGQSTARIAELYDRVLIAADRRMGDVCGENLFTPDTASISEYVGYVAPERLKYPTPKGPSKTIVCSAGGGKGGERLLTACIQAAALFPDYRFSVVTGPRSALAQRDAGDLSNCRVDSVATLLPAMHATADIVVTTGGYNSILEAAMGGARIVVFPNQTGNSDEQIRFNTRLSQFYPIRLLSCLEELNSVLMHEVALCHSSPRPFLDLDVDGARSILEIAYDDFHGFCRT
jgi:predicted glycosyltransferase